MLPFFSAVCVVASVVCCIQECGTTVNCGMCLGSFRAWSVIKLLTYSVSGNLPVVAAKYRTASPLALLKLKFCKYRQGKKVSMRTLQTWSLVPVSSDSEWAIEATGDLQIQQSAGKLQVDQIFPWVPPQMLCHCLADCFIHCPEKLWMPPHRKCSRPGWRGLWATWSSGRCPCPWQGVGTRWYLRALPTQTILWFYARVHTAEAFCQVSSDINGLRSSTSHGTHKFNSFWCHIPYLVKSPKLKGWKFEVY